MSPDCDVLLYVKPGTNWDFADSLDEFIGDRKFSLPSQCPELLRGWAEHNGFTYEFFEEKHFLIYQQFPYDAKWITDFKTKQQSSTSR